MATTERSGQSLDTARTCNEATEQGPFPEDISHAPISERPDRDTRELSGTPSRHGSTPRTLPVHATPARTQQERLSNHGISISLRRKLYISHLFSTWNDRGFEFGAILFLATIYSSTLKPMSIYALVRAASAVIFAPAIGRYIDTGNRLQVMRTSIICRRGAVASACVLFWIMLANKKSLPSWCMVTLLGVNILLACIEKLCSIMNTVSLERDWVVVISDGDETVLRQINSQMRRIDLFCKLVSPLVIALVDGFSTEVAILATLVMNAASVTLEYVLIARVYAAFPSLSHVPLDAQTEEHGNTLQTCSIFTCVASQMRSLAKNLQVYTSQDAFLASISLSILYLTVLSFSGQMVTYLLALGYTSTMVSLIRILSTGCEMSATWLSPWLMSRIGPVRSGLWFLSFQMICLGIAVLIYCTESTAIWAASGLVGGTILSRIGLWGFDLSAQVIIQEDVEPRHRGAFSTTEAALQNLFELLAYTSTIIFSRPSEFKYPAIISISAVYVAGAFYAKFVRDRRGHLFHMSKCMEARGKSLTNYRQIGESLRDVGRQSNDPEPCQ